MALANVSPVHLAVRGTPGAAAVRCAWRGDRPHGGAAGRAPSGTGFGWEQTTRFQASPMWKRFLQSLLPRSTPEYRETAKSNFLAIARGGLSEGYLFLTCFADYTVSVVPAGRGADDGDGGVRPDRDEARSYELYRREHEAGTLRHRSVAGAG